MPSGLVIRLSVLLTLAAVKESPQVLGAGRVGGTVLSSKRAKQLFVSEQDTVVRDGAGFVFVVSD
jgi:hypothetical protein